MLTNLKMHSSLDSLHHIHHIVLSFVCFWKNVCDYCHVLELLGFLTPRNEYEDHNFTDRRQWNYSGLPCR